MYLKSIVLLIVLINVINAQQISVNVYYESLCPDSQKFITQQLYPIMKSNLGHFVNLKFIPYGKSNFTTMGSDVIFNCHHGPNECYGNKVHSCAIEHIQVNSYQDEHTRETLTLEYVNCLMKMSNNFPDSLFPGQKCAQAVDLKNWHVIESCANSTEGSKYLQENGHLTEQLNPMLVNVPTITFRHQFEPESQALAVVNFQRALCQKLNQPLPIECTNLPNGSEKHTGFISMIVLSVAFMFSRM